MMLATILGMTVGGILLYFLICKIDNMAKNKQDERTYNNLIRKIEDLD